MRNKQNVSGWLWVPTLYFAEGLPYFIVNTISVIILKDLGMDNAHLALVTSLIGLPWLLKPLWSPFVDIFKSKRWWILTMQILMAVSVALLALTLPESSPFTLTLIFFTITGFASASHDIAADGFYMIALDPGRQSAFIGIRNTFYRIAMVFGQGVLVVLAGWIEKRTVGSAIMQQLADNPDLPAEQILSPDQLMAYHSGVSHSWTITIVITSLILALVSLWHLFMLPKSNDDRVAGKKDLRAVFGEFWEAFRSFFAKPGIWLLIAFLLLYRLPEAFSVKLLYPFFSDVPGEGGLGLDKEAFGLVYGTAGVIALLAGGILGGWHISRRGLRRCLFPMALSLALPCAVYLFLAIAQPTSIWTVGGCVVFDQFGYGYGFTAYTMYMMFFADGPLKTSHYAICTGFMALSMLLPGAVAGYLQQWLGYVGFFVLVMVCCLATVAVTFVVRRRIPETYGCARK